MAEESNFAYDVYGVPDKKEQEEPECLEPLSERERKATTELLKALVKFVDAIKEE